MLWFRKKLDIKQQILDWERQLYSKGRVADKYDILEWMRLVFDRLYKEDRPAYDDCRNALKANTWDALEELWTLWNPAPKTHVDWVGPNQFTCMLKPTHSGYADCAKSDLLNVYMMNMEAPISPKLLIPAL